MLRVKIYLKDEVDLKTITGLYNHILNMLEYVLSGREKQLIFFYCVFLPLVSKSSEYLMLVLIVES